MLAKQPAIHLLYIIQANANSIERLATSLYAPLTPIRYMSMINSSCENLIKQSVNASWLYCLMRVAYLEQKQSQQHLLHLWQQIMQKFDHEDKLLKLSVRKRYLKNNVTHETTPRDVLELQIADLHKQILQTSALLSESLENYRKHQAQQRQKMVQFSHSLISNHPDFAKLNEDERAVVRGYIKYPPSYSALKSIVQQPILEQHADSTAQAMLELTTAAAMTKMHGLVHTKLPEQKLQHMLAITKLKDEIATKEAELQKVEKEMLGLRFKLASSDEPNPKIYAKLERQKTQHDLLRMDLSQFKKQNFEVLAAERTIIDQANPNQVQQGEDPAMILANIAKNKNQFQAMGQEQRALSDSLLNEVKQRAMDFEDIEKQLSLHTVTAQNGG